MELEAQHQAIASELGYYLIHDEESDSCALRNADINYRGPWHRNDLAQFAWEDAPDYLNDLNAMHEAEKVLTDAQRCKYSFSVGSIAVFSPRQGDRVFATAAQRAEAFLRTIGIWQDSPAS